jgi:hypothetical protein
MARVGSAKAAVSRSWFSVDGGFVVAAEVERIFRHATTPQSHVCDHATVARETPKRQVTADRWIVGTHTHRALGQLTPAQTESGPPEPANLAGYRVHRRQVLGGLTHGYKVAAGAHARRSRKTPGHQDKSYIRAPQVRDGAGGKLRGDCCVGCSRPGASQQCPGPTLSPHQALRPGRTMPCS